ncbi:MAG: hypothetical protein FWB72_02805 [Firmicutes bacterium]|nr:hypothetical protein [Bacillota bacterium]
MSINNDKKLIPHKILLILTWVFGAIPFPLWFMTIFNVDRAVDGWWKSAGYGVGIIFIPILIIWAIFGGVSQLLPSSLWDNSVIEIMWVILFLLSTLGASLISLQIKKRVFENILSAERFDEYMSIKHNYSSE